LWEVFEQRASPAARELLLSMAASTLLTLPILRLLLASAPAFRKDDTPLNRTPGGLMERINASLQRGGQG
jgi:hypothetical protein